MKKTVYYFRWWTGILAFTFIILSTSVFSQNGLIGNGFGTNDWSTTDDFGDGAGNSRILTTTANGTGYQYFRLVTNWDSNSNQWGPSSTADDYKITIGSAVPSSEIIENSTSKAYYIDVSDANDNYVFKTKEGGNPPANKGLIIFEIQGAVRSISSVSQSPTSLNVNHGDNVTVTATLDGSLSTGQSVYLRYSDDSFTSSTFVEMSGSGTSYSADIPASTNTSGNALAYYCFTSGDGLTIAHGDADFYTINLNNNSGNNYSYSVNGIPVLLTEDFSNQSGTNGEKNYTVGYAFETESTLNYTFVASADATGERSFRFKNTSGNERQPATDGTEISVNTATPFTSDIENGSSNKYKITGANTGYRYVFRVDAGVTKIAVFEIQDTYLSTISSVSDNSSSLYSGDAVTVTATLDTDLPDGQAVWLRYSTDDWTSSNIIKMDNGSGTSRSADIPAQTAGTTVSYYAFTSVDVSDISVANVDLYTLEIDNNSGSNYSYSVSALTAPTAQSATAYDQNQIDLNWTQDATHTTVIVVVRQGAAPDDLVQGTAYDQGDGDISDASGYILYKGTDDYSVSDLNHTGLTAGTQYFYKYFTVNNDYYSAAVSADATTYASGDKISVVEGGNWNTADTWSPSGVPVSTDNVFINTNVALDTEGSVGNLTISAGQTLTSEAGQARNINIAEGGTLTNNGTYTANDGKITFLGAGIVSGSITFNDVDINGGVNFGSGSTIDGTLTLNNSSFVDSKAPSYSANSTLTYNINGNYNRGIEWNTPNNVVLSNNTVFDLENGDLTAKELTGSLTINSGSSLSMGAMTGSLNIGGDITLDGTLTLSSESGGDFKLRGNFTNNGTFTHSNRFVEFDGTTNQKITGVTTFQDIIINNAANVTLEDDITVENKVDFANGKLILGNNNLTMSGTTYENVGTNNYIVTDGTGVLRMTATDAGTIFPVGTSAGYAPVTLTKAATETEFFDINVKQGIDNSTGKDDFAVNLQWTIDGVNSNPNVTVKLQWTESDENSLFDRNANVQMGRYFDPSYTANDATVVDYTAELSGITDNLSAGVPFIVANEVAFASNGYVTVQNGRWQDGTTWQGGTVPTTAGDICAIAHHVTVESDLTSSGTVEFGNLTIYENKSLTVKTGGKIAVGVSGTPAEINNYSSLKTDDATAAITLDGTLSNASGASVNMAGGGTLNFADGSTFANNGSFTAGSGTVVFAGAGTGSGTLVFNNLNISGGNVDLGASASLNGTLTVSGTGDLTTNSLTYNEGSLLKLDRDYSLNNTVLWKNTASVGTPQVGVPWNVEIAEDRSVQYTSTDSHYINGSLTISAPSSGTTLFDLGDGTNAGAFFLRGDFINGGTFTHRNQSVTFNGTERQVISGTSIDNFYDLILDNSSGLGLGENLTLDHDLTFSAGKLYLGNKDLTVSGTINSANASKYVVTGGSGYLILTSTTDGTAYPVGTNFSYNPITLSKATTDELMSVRVQNSIDHIVSDPTQIVTMQWTIDEATANGDDITVDLQWNETEETSNFVRGTDLEMAFYNSSYNNTSATLTGTDPYRASRTITGSSVAVSNMPFIVANNGAFTATVFETVDDGDWMQASIWSGGITPSANDIAVVKHNVTSSIDRTVKAVSIDNGASLDCGSNTLNISNGGAIANSGTFNAGTGTVSFTGSGSISTGDISFNHVEINGEVSFGSNSTVNGTLQLNPGGSVRNNPPIYGSNSILKYSTGNVYNRSDEWKPNTDEGPGFPNIVQISKSGTYTSTLSENKSVNEELYCRGIITDEACSYEMTELSEKPLIVNGDVIINGTFSFSSQAGGDLKVSDDFIKGENGSIDWGDNNGRAVFFTGTSTYTQTVSGISSIPFILQTGNGNLQLNNDLNITGSGTNFLSMLGGGTINLNDNNLISVGEGQIDLGNTSGASIEGAGRVEFKGGDGSFSGTNSGTLEFGENTTLAINGGTLSFPSTLGIVTLLGTLEIGDGTTISSLPTYGPSSELHYKKSGTFNPGDEWQAGSDQADNIPFDITLSEGTSDAANLILDDERYAFGTLTINNNADFIIAAETGHLSVNDIIVNSGGLLQLNSPSNMGATASLYISGSVSNNGSMQAQRFFSGNKTNKNLYHYFTPPNASTSSSLFTNSHSSGNFNPNLIRYNESYDAEPDPTSTDYSEWDNFTAAWEPAHDGSSGSGITLTEGKGYAFYNDENRTYTFSGDFLSSDVNTDVSFTLNDANSDYFDGWNMIGNPFTCALDWESDSWDKTYIGNTIYYWDGEEGNYKYYNDASGDQADEADNVLNGGSQFIPAMQAFFVKSTYTSTLSVTIPEAARTYSTQGFFKKKSSKKSFKTDYLKLELTVENKADESVLRFIPEAPDKADNQYDAYKMFTNNLDYPQLFSLSEDNIPLAINSMSSKTDNFTVPLGFTVKQEGLHNFTLNLKSFVFQNKRVFLEDKETGYYEDISSAPEYSFTASGGTDIRDRLVLHILQNQAPEIQITLSDIEKTYGEQLTFNIPEGAFIDPEGDKISYSSNASKAEDLVWLYFNKETLEFSGTAPATGDYELIIYAEDSFGAQASDTLIIQVNKAELTVSAEDAERNYGEENPEFKLNYSGFVGNDGPAEIDELPKTHTEAEVLSPAGSYPIKLSGGLDNNYAFDLIDGTLTILAIKPDVLSEKVYNIEPDKVKAVGEILSDGGTEIIENGFCYAFHQNPDITNTHITAEINQSVFEAEISELQPNTQYYLRAYAQNSQGIAYGESLAFKTSLTNVSKQSLRLQANIYPNPSKGIFKTELNSSGAGLIRITDKAGKIIFLSKAQFEDGVNIINLSHLPAGEYNIELSVQGKHITKKISIQ